MTCLNLIKLNYLPLPYNNASMTMKIAGARWRTGRATSSSAGGRDFDPGHISYFKSDRDDFLSFALSITTDSMVSG